MAQRFTMVTWAKYGMLCNHDNTKKCYINNPNPLLRRVHLKILNLNNFKKVEAMGLKVITSRFT
jgi:hypothetical protein